MVLKKNYDSSDISDIVQSKMNYYNNIILHVSRVIGLKYLLKSIRPEKSRMCRIQNSIQAIKRTEFPVE